MLVSHRKRFIFTKTAKTAGTSVESYFEQYCMLEGEWQESHFRDEYVSDAGIIGYRGIDRRGAKWYNHMSAAEIRDLVGQDTWDRYFKFTVVRNPYDKLISGFFMLEHRRRNQNSTSRAGDPLTPKLDPRSPICQAQGETEVERFRCWIQSGGVIFDRNKYLIDGEACVDYFIRFEELHQGIKHVCQHLSIPFELTRLPEFKRGYRHYRLRIQDYYDNQTRQIVEEKYAWELERFGYGLPE